MMRFNNEVLLGLLILFLGSFILITILSFLYLKFASKKEIPIKKILIVTALISFFWVLCTLVSFLISSAIGLIAYFALSLILIFASSYIITEKAWLLDGKDKIIYPLILGVLFNPAWLFALNLL